MIHPECLIIDDQIALETTSNKKQFANRLGLTSNIVHYADSCEEAIKKLKQHNAIRICYVDCILPRKKNTIVDYSVNFDGEIKENGVKLLPELFKINSKIVALYHSNNLSKTELDRIKEESSNNEKIIACIHKTEPDSVCQKHYKEALSIVIQNSSGVDSSTKKNVDIDKNNTVFDYNSLGCEEIVFIQEKAALIKQLVKRTTQDIFDIGKYLHEVKEKLPHGQYENWLQNEFQWSSKTAGRFMNVFLKFKSDNLSDLNFSPSILYELAAKRVPNEAIEEAINRNKAGEEISLAVAKEIKARHLKSSKSNTPIDSSSSSKSTDQTLEKPLDKASKQKIIRVITKERSWSIGNHIILCDDPNSPAIIEQLPKNISLCLSFPSDLHWQYHHLKDQRSYMSFFSKYPDINPSYLLDLIKHSVETVTDYEDNIVINFIPHLEILQLLDKLECRAFVIDPSYDMCLKLVNVNQQNN